MTTALVKTSKMVKEVSSNVRNHLDVMERARDLYLAQMKRAEADYFERIKQATAIATGQNDLPLEPKINGATPADEHQAPPAA